MPILKQIRENWRKTAVPVSRKGAEAGARLFVHIPKTAGTSFRNSVEARFGKSRVIRDYGKHQAATTKALLDGYYASGDALDIGQVIAAQNAVMVCGHFSISRYGGLIGLPNTASFLRKPLSRVVSHYRHAVRHLDFEGSLLAFARSPAQRNTQSRVLSWLDPALLGFIGLTEEYRRSIDLINASWGWNLSDRVDNVGDQRGEFRVQPNEREVNEILSLNKQDTALYERAAHVFSNSQENQRLGARHEPRGGITLADPVKGVSGWAFNIDSDACPEVELCVQGEAIRSFTPGDFRPALAGWGVPRKGYIGFHAGSLGIDEGSVLELREAESGLLLDHRTVGDAQSS